MRERIGDISTAFIDESISSTVCRWRSYCQGSSAPITLEIGSDMAYLPLVVSTVRDVLQRSYKGAFLLPAL